MSFLDKRESCALIVENDVPSIFLEEEMPWTDKPYTMAFAYQQICAGEEPWVALGNFTNSFFSYHLGERSLLIRDSVVELPEVPTTPFPGEEGASHGTKTLHCWAVFCAASVEYLCEIHSLDVPPWVYGPQFASLPETWYVSRLTGDQTRRRQEQETPEVYRRKNILCGNRLFLDKRMEAKRLRALLEQQDS